VEAYAPATRPTRTSSRAAGRRAPREADSENDRERSAASAPRLGMAGGSLAELNYWRQMQALSSAGRRRSTSATRHTDTPLRYRQMFHAG